MYKYNNMSDEQHVLLSKGIIDLVGDVNEDMISYVREAMVRLNFADNPPISIHISSTGGSVRFGLYIYDLLTNYSGQKTGIVFSIAQSMAAVILQACDVRYSTKHSHILIHHVNRSYIKLDELRNGKKMKRIKKDLEKDQQQLYDILCEKTKKPLKEIKKACALDINMTADEALKFGLIDQVI